MLVVSKTLSVGLAILIVGKIPPFGGWLCPLLDVRRHVVFKEVINYTVKRKEKGNLFKTWT